MANRTERGADVTKTCKLGTVPEVIVQAWSGWAGPIDALLGIPTYALAPLPAYAPQSAF